LAIVSIAQLRAQITAGEVSLQRLSMGATDENPDVMRIRTELNAMRAQLRQMEQSGRREAGSTFVSTSKLPSAGLDYLRSVRDLKYHEVLFELLSKQYEAARIDETRAAPELGVVDLAVPPERKSGPQRAYIVLFSAFLAAGIAAIVVNLTQYSKRPGHDEQLRALRSAIASW
jgi:uncharacterized protein involved in exopolysaccharide biosynthesis